MSIVLYAFRIAPLKLWELQEELRLAFPTVHRHLFEGTNMVTPSNKKLIEEHYTVELQLFEIEGSYIFRVLESGYRVKNYLWKQAKIETVNYDDRVEISAHDELNLRYADEVDERIKKKQYLILPITEVEWE